MKILVAFVDPGGFPPPMVHLLYIVISFCFFFFFDIDIDSLPRIYPVSFFLFSFSSSFLTQAFETTPFIGHRLPEGKGDEIS